MVGFVFVAREAEEATLYAEMGSEGGRQGSDHGNVCGQSGGRRSGLCGWEEEYRGSSEREQ